MSQDDLHNRGTVRDANGDAAAAAATDDAAGDALLDRVTAAVRDMPVPDGPDDSLLSSTLATLRSAEASAALQSTKTSNRMFNMKTLVKLAIAACIAVVAGLVFWPAPSRSSLAFAHVLEQVTQAKSVRFIADIEIKLPQSKTQKTKTTMLIVGNRMRQEMPDMVAVFDFSRGEMLSLQPKLKQGMRVTMQNMPASAKSMNLMEQFRTMKPEQSKDIGLKEIDGRKLRGFLVEQPGQRMTIWADPKTKEPVRIEATMDMPSIPCGTSRSIRLR
jgi:hypothetical protein